MPNLDSRKYYVAGYRLDGQDRYLLWWTNDETDAVWASTAGQIPVFEAEGDVLKFAQQQGVAVEDEEPLLQNLDAAKWWLKDIKRPINCGIALRPGTSFWILRRELTGILPDNAAAEEKSGEAGYMINSFLAPIPE